LKAITRRLKQLEQAFATAAVAQPGWGKLATLRDKLLRLVAPRGQEAVSQLKAELDQGGPTGLAIDLIKCQLADHGFKPDANESLAETIARALSISLRELRACMEEGRLFAALAEQFQRAGIASDIST
jgi:hypothetical protein